MWNTDGYSLLREEGCVVITVDALGVSLVALCSIKFNHIQIFFVPQGVRVAKAFPITDEMLEETVYDRSNPSSLINVVPERLEPMLIRMKPRLAKVFSLPEFELRRQLQPDEKDDKLRLNFWDEYNSSTATGKRMSLNLVVRGVMAPETFFTVYEPSNRKMMWMLCQPASYAVAMRNILQVASQRLLEIVSLPIVDSTGKPDTRVIVNILRAFQLVDMRVKGSITQNVNIKQQSLNLHRTISDNNQPLAGMDARPNSVSIEELDIRELEKLERRIATARKDAKRLAETARIELLPADSSHERMFAPKLPGEEVFRNTFLAEPIDDDIAMMEQE
jgi:hypothetical protein